jgi:hypothetical protein
MKHILIHGLLLVGIVSFMTGCYVPEAYQVVNSVNPQYEDQDVRFRTTYYLRVFDLCRVDEDGKYGKYDRSTAQFVHRTAGRYRIVKDSLYRFRMTGQSQAFHNDVHFESGTLRDYQVDPFGRSVEFDETLKRFRATDDRSVTPNGSPNSSANQELSKAALNPRPTQVANNPCPDGEAKDTKFFLLGPEGIKELDPAERLVMAMSTDAKPLISALQRIAGIKVQTEEDAAAQYQVKREMARTATAMELLDAELLKLEKLEKDKSPDDATSPNVLKTTVIDLFETKAKNGRQQ